MQDPSAKEADTYYGMRSTVAFPVKGTEIKRKDDFKAPQAKADIELNLKNEKQDVPNQKIQLGSTPVRENSKPVGFFM
ncbi:hypothetical protein LOAG_10367 [Loa loa]|uniref:Uncharacterized protein n=1 Tax=Loa loa TaxID=7209 RepID=A0A1S0TQ15_LOALO|nr:hypothetical protein LOAG_10367 [Loa loa]EFO18131.1 hypothetical protein LOAG_10367 [Loa loa]